nr:MAG TPA: hypothetical protein [Caudoviricetes sp.]
MMLVPCCVVGRGRVGIPHLHWRSMGTAASSNGGVVVLLPTRGYLAKSAWLVLEVIDKRDCSPPLFGGWTPFGSS